MMVEEVEKGEGVGRISELSFVKVSFETFFPLEKCGGGTLFRRKVTNHTKTENKSGCSLSS